MTKAKCQLTSKFKMFNYFYMGRENGTPPPEAKEPNKKEVIITIGGPNQTVPEQVKKGMHAEFPNVVAVDFLYEPPNFGQVIVQTDNDIWKGVLSQESITSYIRLQHGTVREFPCMLTLEMIKRDGFMDAKYDLQLPIELSVPVIGFSEPAPERMGLLVAIMNAIEVQRIPGSSGNLADEIVSLDKKGRYIYIDCKERSYFSLLPESIMRGFNDPKWEGGSFNLTFFLMKEVK